MENLFGNIQHFFIAVFTTVTTAVMVALPFHKPLVLPTPNPTQEVLVQKEATPSSTPEKVLGVNKIDSQATNTPTPSTSGQTQQNTKNNQAKLPSIIHDGSRTGNIIKYHEWCSGKDISVYENELLEKKGTDGKTYKMTQGDWDCYNRANSQPQQNQPTPVQNQQQVSNGQNTTPITSNNWVQPNYAPIPSSANTYNAPPIVQSCSEEVKTTINNTIASIKGSYQSSIDTAILNTARELGRRGITGGAYYDTELANAAFPATNARNAQLAQYCISVPLSCPCNY